MIKSILGVVALSLWIVLMVSLFLLTRTLYPSMKPRVVKKFHSGVVRLCNIKVITRGQPADTPTFYVSNHVSYLDVFVIGSILEGRFVAKSNVEHWPILGKLAKLQNTVFIERNPRRASEQVAQLGGIMAGGDSLFVFPEGTSTPGTLVHKFKPSLFAAANARGVSIQPITIAYTEYESEPMTQDTRDRYAWYLPMTFAPHFFAALGLRRATVVITLHQSVGAEDFTSRKALATHCESVVRNALLADLKLDSEVVPERYLKTLSQQ